MIRSESRLPLGPALVLVLGIACVVRGDDPMGEGNRGYTPPPFTIQDSLLYTAPPIDYYGDEAGDPVAALAERVRTGKITLEHQPDTGYLRSVLAALDVPVESQLLVFSKTALNVRLINHVTPRAIFFNDDVYVGWVPGTAELEVSADDPHKGGMFYTLSQNPEREIRFERENRCLACHAGSSTLKVPGHLARSFLVDDKGRPQTGFSRITHDTPFEKRFGGWYVTGDFGDATHMGNLRDPTEAERWKSEPAWRTNLAELTELVDLSKYPSAHSDAVAHLVLHHQLHGRNLITRVAYEARLGKRSDAEEQLLRYLFFVDEPPLESPVRGTTGYREWFESRGPKDAAGISLRKLNLETRLFEHRLSYLVDSNSFAALPDEVRGRMWQRIDGVLAGENPTPEFARIPAPERAAIRAILDATRDR